MIKIPQTARTGRRPRPGNGSVKRSAGNLVSIETRSRGLFLTGRDPVPRLCLVAFSVIWAALAVHPRYRADWFLENLLVFAAVPAAVLGARRFRFSDRSYVQLTLFLVLHTVGSHYTYSEVPLGDWLRDALDLSRNHYDRVVHLAFGILALRPVRELAFRGKEPGRLATLLLAVASVVGLSVTYEIIEWLTAIVVDPEAGTAFLGTQGDEWDAQKDMALAAVGALAAAVFEAGRGPASDRLWETPYRGSHRHAAP